VRSLVKPLVQRAIARLSSSAVNGPDWLRSASVYGLASLDDRRRIRTRHGSFTLRTGTPIERWRADTLFDKEPETLAWLERTIDDASVFFDVGANVGLYTLFACHLRPERVRAVCFEPESQNFARLNQNIRDNGLSSLVLALPVALGARDGVQEFGVSRFVAGAALHGEWPAGGAERAALDHRQGILVTSLDLLLARMAGLPRPTHLKIDVDGPELDVLAGAGDSLADPRLRHLMIEVGDDRAASAEAILAARGWRRSGAGKPVRGYREHFFERWP
jgi:FkbM family methyltransferase